MSVSVKEIESTQFKYVNGTTKDLINMGEWFLYEIKYKSFSDAQYYLATDNMNYFLSHDGTVVGKTPKTPEDLDLSTTVKFSDLPQPSFTRNYFFQWA